MPDVTVVKDPKHRVHYVSTPGASRCTSRARTTPSRAHCKHIDYKGEIVDTKALRRLISENKKHDGFIVAESERVMFHRNDRRRAVLVDLDKTNVVTADDFPTIDGGERTSDLGGNVTSQHSDS